MLHKGQSDDFQGVFGLQRGDIKAQHVAYQEKRHYEFVASGLDNHKVAGPKQVVKDDCLKRTIRTD